MDSKFYVSLKAARLLKEKGYNEECDYSIDDDSDIYECDAYRMNQDLPEWKWSCPTKVEAIDWLDTKEIVVEISFVRNRKWRFSIYKNGWFQIDSWIHDKLDFSTRLEAEEAAIIGALKLL